MAKGELFVFHFSANFNKQLTVKLAVADMDC